MNQSFMYCAMVALLISGGGRGGGLVVIVIVIVGVSGGFALGTVGFGMWDVGCGSHTGGVV